MARKVLAVAMAAGTFIVLSGPRSAFAQQTPAAPPDNTDSSLVQHELEQLSGVLKDPQSRAEQREEAARRLVAQHSPAAMQVLRDTLVDVGNPPGQLAAARALADDPQPDPALLNPLFALLGPNRQLTESAARALANYNTNPDVLTRLIDRAQRRTQLTEITRREIVRAIGSIPDKRAAEFLVNLLNSRDESPAIRSAAADALTELAGITEYGQDPEQWSRWWTRMADLPDDRFRNELLPRVVARYGQIRQQYNDLAAELNNILTDQYNATPVADRPALLLKNLRSGVPEIRAAAATIVDEDKVNNVSPTPAVLDQLRQMIGDSSPKVRFAVALALADINDANALEPLLAQLSQETDPAVRPKLIQALQQINDPRAARAMLKLVNDPSYATAKAAVEAIGKMGPQIRVNSALAQEMAGELQQAFEKLNPSNPGNTEMRVALINAMVPLQQEGLRPLLIALLDERRGESSEIRRAAIKALGDIGNPQSASRIADMLDDPASTVRFEAVNALAKLSNAAVYAEPLRRRLDPTIEPDKTVTDAAWKAMETIFPSLSKEQLRAFADHFQNDPAKRLVVLKALADKLVKENNQNELATTRIDIGDADMKLGEFKEAAEYFKNALEYKKSQGMTGVVINNLIEQRMRALLLSQQYPEAVAFANQSITADPANQQTMGSLIRQEVERLKSANDFANALNLIQEAQKIELAKVHLDQLNEIESEIKRRNSERGGNPLRIFPPENAGLYRLIAASPSASA